ncbi:hypothetical protein BF17_22040 [Yersinia similis]|uniref:Toxin CdiA n=3 Tax=Yersinia similis TaxID=367190 RepID=A0ABN4CT63_9GAMM|nr:hypothetical protein BF17_22040 [Yersinia similis]
MSTGGIGVTVGSSSTKMTDSGQSISSVGSTVGSVLGNVSMTAGEDLRVQGAEVLAGKDISLTGKNVSILAAENQLTQSHTVEQKQSGLTLALSGAVGSAVNTAVTTAKAASEESSGRLGALQGVKAALNGVQAVQAGQLVQAEGGDAASMFGISASLGSQKSSSEQHQEQTHVTGSTLTAGNNLTINATGEGNAANSGDIVVQGSQLQAGGDTTLDAARDVLLLGAANTQKTDGSNSSSGGSVGVSLGISGASSGLSIFANANKGQGSEHGDGTSWTETTLDSGGTLSLYSGRDTSLVGAQVSGETVKVEVGRDLLLQSQQDSDNYDAKQQNSSVGGSFSPGSMTGSISINGSQDKLNSNFDSVQEQTGIFAGSGGFDITVGGHTQLDGAVIGSTATADKNTLDTGTLGFSDIDNQADFKVEHQSVGISTGGNIGSQFVGNMANGLLVGANNEGHADSTTHAAVSEGTITVRDTDNQQQNVDDLSRDVEQANNALSPIFDKEKEQNRLKEAQLIGEIGSQVGDVFRTQGQIIATQAATEKMQGVSEADREAAKANWEKANPGQVATAEDINGQVYKTAYDQAFNASGYGTGGKFQQAVQAATAALQGLAGGDLAQAIAGGSAPYLAEVIKQSTGDNEEARLAAHAVVGSVLAHLQGNSAVAGGAGALTGEIAADLIMQQLYPGKMVSELSETEKQTISALSTLAAGLAGGLTGDSSADAVAGAQAGKNAVENNYLSATEALSFDQELQTCTAKGNCDAVREKYGKLSEENSEKLKAVCQERPLTCEVYYKEVIQGGIATTERPDWLYKSMSTDEAKAFVQQVNGQDLALIDTTSESWMKFAAFASDPENQAAVLSLGVAGKNLIQLAQNSLATKSLLKEMTAQGIKYSPENIVSVARDSSGKIIFLETGSPTAGLQHIIKEHGSQFSQLGVSEAQIPSVVMKAVTQGKVVGYQGSGTGRPIYETIINGQKYNIAVTVGSNGYIVGANLRGVVK